MPIATDLIAKLPERLSTWRRDLHRCPELGLELPKTKAYVLQELRGMGLEPQILGHGIAVDMGPPGPRIAWRADMDGLPIHEETGAPYASQHPGVMHACGHDAHMAIALGLTWVLSSLPSPPPVRILFQPDEEGRFGAQPLIEAGALKHVQAILGVHVGQLQDHLGPGQVAVRTGTQMAASDRFKAVFRGQGTHGAQPHLGRDPLGAAAHLVGALQALHGREVHPGHLALISVGRLTAGNAANVIPETAELEGIIRTEHPADRNLLVCRAEEVARGIAAAYDVNLEWSHAKTCPAVRNHSAWVRKTQDAVIRLLGYDSLLEMPTPSATSDDMAFYLEHVPGVYAFFGTHHPAQGLVAPNHSPHFDLDESQLWKAVALGAELIQEGAWPHLKHDYQL